MGVIDQDIEEVRKLMRLLVDHSDDAAIHVRYRDFCSRMVRVLTAMENQADTIYRTIHGHEMEVPF